MALCGLGIRAFFRRQITARWFPLRHSREAGRQAVCSPPRVSRGRTIGAILAAISFPDWGHSETVALGMAAAWQHVQGRRQRARRISPAGARRPSLRIVADAP